MISFMFTFQGCLGSLLSGKEQDVGNYSCHGSQTDNGLRVLLCCSVFGGGHLPLFSWLCALQFAMVQCYGNKNTEYFLHINNVSSKVQLLQGNWGSLFYNFTKSND